MESETKEQLIDRRFEQTRKSATEAIRIEVEWLRRHNFPVWVSVNGRIVDVSKNGGTDAHGG